MLEIGKSTGGDGSSQGPDIDWTYSESFEDSRLEEVVPVLVYTSIGGQRAWGSKELRDRVRVFNDEVENHRLQLHGKRVEPKHRGCRG